MEIISVSTRSMINQTLKSLQGLCLHVNVVCLNGRFEWSLSFSPEGETRTMDDNTEKRFFLITSVYLEKND